MRVLITGSKGFIARYLCSRLAKEDGLTTQGIDLHSILQSSCDSFRIRDIRDRDGLALEFDIFRPHVVMHLAATLGVQNVMDNPGATIRDNVVGTMNVIELAQSYGAHVFFASTSDIYGHNTDLPFKEDSYSVIGPSHEPRWSYAISKLAGEHLTQAANGTILRFFNITGPGQSDSYVLPYFIKTALQGKNIQVYGDGSQSRCFTDVRDVSSALVGFIDLCVADEQERIEGETYNLGSTHEVTMLELAHLVREIVNPSVNISLIQPPHLYTEMPHRKPDTTKVKELLGWRPRITLRRTIEDTASYWRNIL